MLRAFAASTALVALLVVPTVASAQNQPAEIGVGYSFHRLTDGNDSMNMPAGWLVSVAKPMGRSPLFLVGEVAGGYKSEEGETLRLHTFQGGLRIAGGRNMAVRPFAQFLLGGLNAGCCGDSANFFLIEPGGGAEVRLSDRVSMRLGLSAPIAFYDGDAKKSVRFQAGVSVPLW